MSLEKKCFIISPIGKENSEQREHADQVFNYVIKPALDECNIIPIRSDKMYKAGKITEQMYNAIQTFDMCIAVLAFDNPNVYYELAVAQCASRPVIILMEKEKEIPFDLKDERVIHYDLGIPSYDKRIHINAIIENIKNFEEINWKVPCSIPGFGDMAPDSSRDHKYFETSQKFGGDEVWKKIIQDSEKILYLMGTALNAWRYTYTEGENFGDILVKKAKEGCKIKVLIMNPDNDFLLQIHNEHIIPILPEEVRNTVKANVDFYSKYAEQSENIEFRQINTGRLTQNQAINDKYGIYIPHFYSIKSSNFPLWKFNKGSNLYNQLLREFNGLWKLNAPIMKEVEPEKIEEARKMSIYMSYSSKDAELFKIKEIAETLTRYKEIEDVPYWQEDRNDNIIKYTSDIIDKCDVMLLFCSPNALKSILIEREWTTADIMNKPIIPIFVKPDHIPPLLKTRLGIEYDMINYKEVIENIYNLILKKTKSLSREIEYTKQRLSDFQKELQLGGGKKFREELEELKRKVE